MKDLGEDENPHLKPDIGIAIVLSIVPISFIFVTVMIFVVGSSR
jgi:hypothetical protein